MYDLQVVPAQSWLAGGASDVCMAEMCNILLWSVQSLEPCSTGSWLRSGLLGSRTQESHLLTSVDISMQTAGWLYPFRECTDIHLAAVLQGTRSGFDKSQILLESCTAFPLNWVFHKCTKVMGGQIQVTNL